MISWFMTLRYRNFLCDLAIDRAGLVGADGATHAGIFDVAYLCCLPGMVVMCPSDEAELTHMVATAASYDDGPSAVRYPRGVGVGCELPNVARYCRLAGVVSFAGEMMWPFFRWAPALPIVWPLLM